MVEAARKEYSRKLWNGRLAVGAMASFTVASVGGIVYLQSIPMEYTAGVAFAGFACCLAAQFVTANALDTEEQRILSGEGLNRIFERTHASQVPASLPGAIAPHHSHPALRAACTADSRRGCLGSCLLATDQRQTPGPAPLLASRSLPHEDLASASCLTVPRLLVVSVVISR